jgi:hypothetical protein
MKQGESVKKRNPQAKLIFREKLVQDYLSVVREEERRREGKKN